MANDKIKTLYDAVVKDGYDVGSEDDFRAGLQNEQKRSSLYKTLTNDGYDLGDYKQFSGNVSAGTAPANTAKPIVKAVPASGFSQVTFPKGTKEKPVDLDNLPVPYFNIHGGGFKTMSADQAKKYRKEAESISKAKKEKEADDALFADYMSELKESADKNDAWKPYKVHLKSFDDYKKRRNEFESYDKYRQSVGLAEATQYDPKYNSLEKAIMALGSGSGNLLSTPGRVIDFGGYGLDKALKAILPEDAEKWAKEKGIVSAAENYDEYSRLNGNWAGGFANSFSDPAARMGEATKEKTIGEDGRLRYKDFSDYAKEGDYAGVAGDMFRSGLQSLPQSLTAMVAPELLWITSAPSFTDKYAQLEKDYPKMSELDRFNNAAIGYLGEVLSESVGGSIDSGIYKGLVKQFGEKNAEKFLEKYGVSVALGGATEGLEEGLSNTAGQLADINSGIQKDFSFKDLGKSMAYGATSGLGMTSGMAAPASLQAKFPTYQAKRDLKKSDEAGVKLYGSENWNVLKNAIDENPQGALAFVATDPNFTVGQRNAALRYAISQARVKSIEAERAKKVNDVQQKVTDFVQKEANPDMNAVVTAMMTGIDKPVQITKGNIAQHEDGTIDKNNSDNEIYYVDENGQTQVTSIDAIENIVERVAVEDAAKQIADEHIATITAQQENEDIRPYNEGEQVRVVTPQGQSYYGTVIGENETGYEFEDGATGATMFIEPRQIVNEDNLEGVEQGGEVDYIGANGEQKRGVVNDLYNHRSQGAVIIDGEMVPVENVIGLREPQPTTDDTPLGQIGQDVSDVNIDGFIGQMEENAAIAPQIELTPENWIAEFGEKGEVETPIGTVKMGENQLAKMFLKNRGAEFGMIKPTLTDPDLIVEKQAPQEGAERDTKLLFVKTFIGSDGKKHTFFESVTVSQDGMEVSISNHIVDRKAIAKELINGTIAYNKFANRSDSYLPETQNGLPDIVPSQANTVSMNKGTTNTGENKTQTFELPGNKTVDLMENGDGSYSSTPTVNKAQSTKLSNQLRDTIDTDAYEVEVVKMKHPNNPMQVVYSVQVRPKKSTIGANQNTAELGEISTNEDYWGRVSENSTDITEILNAYNAAMSVAGEEALLPWQQELIGRKIHRDSFNRFSDPNKARDAQAWLAPKNTESTPSNSIDTIAQELSEYGVEVTPEMIVEFMEDHPRNKVENGSEYTRALNDRFKQVASQMAGQSIGGIESVSGRMFANVLKNFGSGAIKQAEQSKVDESGVENDLGNISTEDPFATTGGGINTGVEDKVPFQSLPESKIEEKEKTDASTSLSNQTDNEQHISEKKMKPIGRQLAEKLIERLKATGLAKNVIADKEKMRARLDEILGNKGEAQFMRTPQGEVYGFVDKDGTIYLDPDKMNANTPIHEFGHLWQSFIEKNNPELYAKGVELIKNSPYMEAVKNNPAYANLSEKQQIDEAMAMAIGDKGEQVVNKKGLGQKLIDWINEVWQSIGNALGIRNLTPEQIQDLTLGQFTKGAVGDLLSGESLNRDSNKIEGLSGLNTQNKYSNSGNNSNFAGNENSDKGNETGLGNRRTMERSTKSGLVGTQPSGNGIERTISSSNSGRSRSTTSESVQSGWDKASFKQGLEKSAKENGVWIDNINDIAQKSDSLVGGFENEPYISTDGKHVIKLNNLNFLNDNDTQYEHTRDFDYFIDRLNSHNELFPEDKYEIMGFAKNSQGEVSVVLKQEYVHNATLATQQRIDEYLQEIGFEKTELSNGLQGYTNSRYELSDAKPANVLVDENGDLRFIDLDISSSEYVNKEKENAIESKPIQSPLEVNDINGTHKVIDLNNTPELEKYLQSSNPTKAEIKEFQKWLNEHKDDYVRLYHGTSSANPIQEKGLLKTANNRRKSLQSGSGYVYLSRNPKDARFFGEMNNSDSTIVYAVDVKIKDLLPDTDQLSNKRSTGYDIGNSLAESLIFGNGARVKRNIMPYELSKTSFQINAPQSELDKIKAKAIVTGTFMKAPNGKPTNLNEKQWLQVRSQNFLDWFGDWINNPETASKVVDENGEPMVVYHGTKADFTEFKEDMPEIPTGFWFASDKEVAEGHGNNLKSVFINSKNPTSEYGQRDYYSENGFDSYIYDYGKGFNINVENPTQIKSATDNTGEFGTDNADIRYQTVSDVADAVGSTMTEEKRKELDEALNTRWAKFRENWEDRHLPVKEFLDILRDSGMTIADHDDYYKLATHVAGKNDAQLTAYEKRYQEPLNKLISDISKHTGHKLRDIENYAILKHGLERNAYMRQKAIDGYKAEHPKATAEQIAAFEAKLPTDFSGVETVEEEVGKSAQEFIDEFEHKAGKDLTDNFWKKVNAATQFAIKKQLEGGQINKAFYDELTNRFKYYIPLRGHDAETAEDRWDYSPDMGVYFSNPIMTAKGRRSRSESPFAYIAQQAQSAIGSSNRNVLDQTILRMARKDKSGLMSVSDSWYVQNGVDENGRPIYEQQEPTYSPDPEVYQKNIEEFEERMQQMEQNGLAMRDRGKLDVGGLFIKPKQAQQHTIKVRENGKEYTVYINANPAVAQAINGSNVKQNMDLGVVGSLMRGMAKNFTTRNPEFILRNFTRDYIMASSILPAKEGLKYTGQFMKNTPKAADALQRYIRNAADLNKVQDRYMIEYIMNGGKTGFSHLMELQKTQKKLEKEIARAGKGKGAMAPIDGLLKGLEAANDFAENLTRLSVYITSREQGRSVEQSISDAKEVTVNFNRSGAGGMGARYFRPLFLFSNVAIQALSNLSKVTIKNPKKAASVLATYAAIGYLAPMLAQLIGGDDGEDEYWKLSEKERHENLIIPTGTGFIKIPLPQELRVFNAMGNNIYQAVAGKKDVTEVGFDTLVGLSDLFPTNPVGSIAPTLKDFQEKGLAEGLLTGGAVLAPDVAKPLAQLAANRDYFGRSIENEYANKHLPEYRTAKTNKKGETYAPEPLVYLAEKLNSISGGDKVEKGLVDVNPDVINHLARGYVGGLYDLGVRGIGLVEKGIKGDAVKTRDIPITRSFYASKDDLPPTSNNFNSAYFEAKDKAETDQYRLKQYQDMLGKGEMTMDDYMGKIGDKEMQKSIINNHLINQIQKMEKAMKEGDENTKKELEAKTADLKKVVIGEISLEDWQKKYAE